MLLSISMHVISVLFLVRFNNFALTTDFYWSYTRLTVVARSYALLVYNYYNNWHADNGLISVLMQ